MEHSRAQIYFPVYTYTMPKTEELLEKTRKSIVQLHKDMVQGIERFPQG